MSELLSMIVCSLCASRSEPISIPLILVDVILIFEMFFGLKGVGGCCAFVVVFWRCRCLWYLNGTRIVELIDRNQDCRF